MSLVPENFPDGQLSWLSSCASIDEVVFDEEFTNLMNLLIEL